MTNEDAINILKNRLNTYYCSDEDLEALDLAIKALEEKPQGKWITVYDTYNICSVCDYKTVFDNYKFCPNCGADMRGDNNG